ncbi:MAG: hypothetical protein ABSD74_17970 [Rhizomicrobium sp.]|jgi:predicted TIM-barrel fold metal-dependent hydrolase
MNNPDSLTGLNRREALLSTLVALAWPTMARAAPLPAAPGALAVPPAFIDVHCHVSNAHDIPVTEFLIDTAMKEDAVAEPWTTLAPVLSRMAQAFARLDDPELALIQLHPAVNAAALPTQAQEKSQFAQMLEQALTDTRNAGRLQPGAGHVLDLVPKTALGRMRAETSPDMFVVHTPNGPVSANLDAACLIRLLTKFGIDGTTKANIGTHLGTQPAQKLELQSIVSDADIAALAALLAAESAAQQTDYGAILYVFGLILETRLHNIDRMDSSLGTATEVPSIVRLFLPALVDFDCWYSSPPAMTISQPSLSIDRQTKIMAKLGKMQSDPKRFVNGYVAFDPLRALLVESELLKGPAPLTNVEEAVEHLGFAGVALHPAMGFAPAANSLSNSDFGPVAAGWIAKLAPRNPLKKPYLLGPELDRVLDDLYTYCLERDIPIMAHCNNSLASFAGAGTHAAPSNWRRLLTRTDRDFSTLRLNLAYFGNARCHEARQPAAPGDPMSQAALCAAAWQWTSDIVSMICETNGYAPRFPNLYFDSAGLGLIASNPSNLETLRAMLDSYSPEQKKQIAKRMLYGSDWFFLAIAGKQHLAYISAVHELVKDFVPDANLFHENAARFLGLTRDGITATRLQLFYRDVPGRLNEFSTLIV